MAISGSSRRYEFGPYRLETSSRTLLRDGARVPLPSRAYDTLVVLVGQPGQIVDRNALMSLVWPDAVVEENNLTQCIMAIRKALGEHYIVTFPGRGYSFAGPVRESAPEAQGRRLPAPRTLWGGGLLAALVLVAGAFWLGSNRPSAEPRFTPLTGSPGEARPAFSPDGLRIVYDWQPEGENYRSLFVKQIGAGDPLRLTRGSFAASPAWSPDGRYIAFLGDPPGVYLIPALGGAARMIASTHRLDAGGRAVAWFPDGKRLALKDRDPGTGFTSIFEVSIDTGERRQLTRAVSVYGDVGPAVSPDGKTLGFVRTVAGGAHAVYLMPAAGGEPRQLTRFEEQAISLAWTPDGREIVYAARPDGFNSLWRVPVSGGTPRRVSIAGYDVMLAAIAPVGNRLAFTHRKSKANLWRVSLDKAAPPEQIAPTTRRHITPQYSPDGLRLAFASDRSGYLEVWTSDVEGRGLMQVTTMTADGGRAWAPRWSPDGLEIVFAGGPAGPPDIFATGVHGGAPRRITAHSAEDMFPSYSRDGRWIYFTSYRTGAFEIWKAPRSGGEAVQVTTESSMMPIEGPGGVHVYYFKRSQPGIWRRPTAGGPETPVVENPRGWKSEGTYALQWTLADSGLLFYCEEDSGTPRSWAIRRLDPRTGTNEAILQLPKPAASLTVSPDGRTLVYTQAETEVASIMVVENFR